MAKRKRLETSIEPFSFDLETKSAILPRARMPIAEVAGDTAGRASLEEVAREMTKAEGEGRVVKSLPIASISTHHLARDRLVMSPEDMETLKASLSARGQQTPIEVVGLGDGTYGLISGLRRVEALRALDKSHVLALVRRPKAAADAYRAMVEENEIRADLSFYERANIAVIAAGQGVYRTPREAVSGLFAHVPSARRSKILKFVTICQALGSTLRFPTAIPEKLGLKLAGAIETDRKIATRLSDALRKTPPGTALEERRALERVLKMPPSMQGRREEIAPGVILEMGKGRVVFSGPSVDEAFVAAARDWAMRVSRLS